MKKIVISIFLLGSLYAFGQSSFIQSYKLDWSKEVTVLHSQEDHIIKALHFEGATYDRAFDNLPIFSGKMELSRHGKLSAVLVNAVYKEVSNQQVVNTRPGLIKGFVEVVSAISYYRKKPMASYSFIPLRINASTGKLEKLVSFDLEINTTPVSGGSFRGGGNYASNSVLGSGQWYTISTTTNGVHRIDYNFLRDSIGLNVDQINPANIRVYGNGGGMLPESNDAHRNDDLVENTIFVSGQQDGSFDPQDYILFYGQNPDQWYPYADISSNPQRYYHQKHLYDNRATYYITASLGPGKRITSQSSEAAFDYAVTSYDGHVFHEIEKDNLVESGRVWYGETLDFLNATANMSFNMSGLIPDSALFLSYHVAGRTIVNQLGFGFFINQQQVDAITMGKVSANYDQPLGRKATNTVATGGFSSPLSVKIDFYPDPQDIESVGWVDYVAINGKQSLSMNGPSLIFGDYSSVGKGVSEFRINSNNNITVWDISNPLEPRNQNVEKTGNTVRFRLRTDSLKRFAAFDGTSYPRPKAEGMVANQDLHGNLGQPDMVIITHSLFTSQANRLADHHRSHDNMTVKVVQVDRIYHEFSSGAQDVTAIRDMMKMLYDRAGNDESLMPDYLILFGDGSFDYKNLEVAADVNTNFIPTYQSYESIDRAGTFTSDDYFGLLDDNEGANINFGKQELDVAVGRLMVEDVTEAETVVNKIIQYNESSSYGNWRNLLTFIADDEDGITHIDDANDVAVFIENNYPVYNIDKIYLDAYTQISTPGGSRYPDVNKAIENRMFRGTLLINYVGHGGESGWAHERILNIPDINNWVNRDRLPLFVTATCSFSRYDNPTKKTAGELTFTQEEGGAIGLVTTVRLVYSGANDALNTAFYSTVFEPVDGEMPTLGHVMVNAKNGILSTLSNTNNRKFTLLGDPALKLAYPEYRVHTTRFDNDDFSSTNDTLKALAKVTIEGEVRDGNGDLLNGYNGVVYPSIYDKPVSITTLENDPASSKYTFSLQKSLIYSGKASVTNGKFQYTFIVPKDISYNLGQGKISYYSNGTSTDAHGFDNIVIGGTSGSVSSDEQGPDVQIFMNDEKFIFGGMTDDDPVMVVKLVDESGINTTGNSIGHDISGILDEDAKNSILLNEFYEAELDNYQAGEVRYPLSKLIPGRHSISVKAWDVYNNSGEGYTEFVVAESADLALDHVLNYPNPFTSNTAFWFEHNRPGQLLNVKVEIFTVSGRLIKTIQQDVISEGNRVDNIEWDGLDEFGDRIGRGVYVYKVNVFAPDGSKASKFEKLVVLR